MTGAIEAVNWKKAGVVILVALGCFGGVAAGAFLAGARSVDIASETRRADAAQQREAQAKVDAAAAGRLVEDREREVARLREQLARNPLPPPVEPVPADASAAVVVQGLQGLGLHPVELGASPAVGLNLPDGRTVLSWGREVQRVPPLVERLETLEQLARAQEGATGALHQQVARLTTALQACDEGREAERRLAQLRAPERPWSVGLLVGVDSTGTKRLGAYASRSFGPIQIQAVVLGNQAALGGGVRF